jgi:hypothetical protein
MSCIIQCASYAILVVSSHPVAPTQGYHTMSNTCMSQQDMIFPSATSRVQIGADGANVVQGHVFWLPAEEELPPRAVRRAHGKGAVEEGIYGHPVVAVSRPAEESHTVHIQLVSAFHARPHLSLTRTRYLRCKARHLANCTTSQMSSTSADAGGTCQYRRAQIIQTQPRRRQGSDFQLLNWPMVRFYAEIHT